MTQPLDAAQTLVDDRPTTELVVRRLLIDLEQPVERHWGSGDVFLTAWFNALWMSFPIGEQFFIDAVRTGFKALPAEQRPRWQAEVQGLVGQEATHRRIHALFNAQIEKHGLVDDWEPSARERLRLVEGIDPRHALAITAANEHFTVLFAEWLLAQPARLGNSEPRLKAMWLWHSAGEAEHKCTAFDLYQALGGSQARRVTWMRRITWVFLTDVFRQTVNNLRCDRTLWRWRSWYSAARHMLGRNGLLRQSWAPWRAYFKPGFHPSQQSSALSERWVRDNTSLVQPVRRAT